MFKSSMLKLSTLKLFGHSDLQRWVSSFVLVVAVYVGTVFAVLNWPSSKLVESGEPMAAMIIELAPMPTAPPVPSVAAPPGEIQEEIQATPEPKPAPEITESLPEIPEVAKAEAILPPEPESVEEIEEQEQDERPEQQEQAPVVMETPPDEVAAAPKQGAVSLTPSHATLSWQSVLLGHLESHKRYPRESRRRRQEAIVYVRVQINRDGTVVDYRLERACLYEPLNQESLALVARAQPLPPPPEDFEGETIEFVVPVEFSLRR